MYHFSEEFLQFVWSNKLFTGEYLHVESGAVSVVDTGTLNTCSGPDFFNAKVKIGRTLWVGNVEIHLRSSDWFRHGHHRDPAYDSIILHAVFEHDQEVFRMNGELIPTVRLTFSNSLLSLYRQISDRQERKCAAYLSHFEKIYLQDWMTKLVMERLMERDARIKNRLSGNQSDWEETLYFSMARAFGMNRNQEVFEMLADKVPLKFILKNRNNPVLISAAFYGQAGFLDELISEDTWYTSIQKEYRSIRAFLPEPLPGNFLWKKSKSRPPGYPDTRISQLSGFVSSCFPWFDVLIGTESLSGITGMLRNGMKHSYTNCFLYGRPGRRLLVNPGSETISGLIINGVLPVLFTYSRERNKPEITDRVIRFLEELPPEKNEIIFKWRKAGLGVSGAFESQALIQLENRYCRQGNCLKCMIGSRILTVNGK